MLSVVWRCRLPAADAGLGVGVVGDRVIAAVVPPQLSGALGRQVRTVRGGRLPIGELLALPRTGSLIYGMARIDVWGVVSNRAVVTDLGWVPGDRLTIAVVSGSVVVHRDPAGTFALGTKPYLVLPAAVRHRGGLQPGDQVLLVADANHEVLVVHPLRVLDAMIATYHASLAQGGDHDDQPTR